MAVITYPAITGVNDLENMSTSDPYFDTLGLGTDPDGIETLAIDCDDTLASGASVVWNGINVETSTLTLTGSTNITTATGLNLFSIAAPALVGTVTVTNAATVSIIGPPTISGGGAITNPYALWVQAGVSRFGGPILAPDGTAAAPSYAFASRPTTGIYSTGTGVIDITLTGTRSYAYSGAEFFCFSNSASIKLGASSDVQIHRDAAAVLALKNGTTAQEFRVYGTTTGPKYLSVSHNGTNGVLSMASGMGGLEISTAAGSVSGVILGTVGVDRWYVLASPAGGLTAAANYRFAHGTSALATTATEGFLHIQSCAGAPSGVPASIPTGQIPSVIDSTNLRAYYYIAGTWRYAALT